MDRIGEVEIDGERIFISKVRFTHSGGIAFQLICSTGEPYAKLGVNLVASDIVPPGRLPELAQDEFFVRMSDYEELNKKLLATDIFVDTGKRVRYGRNVLGGIWKYNQKQ